MNEEQEHDIILRWLSDKATEEEVRSALSDETFIKYKQIVKSMDQLVPDLDEQVFDPKLVTSQPKQGKTRQLNWWMPVSIAASFIILLLAGWFILNTDKEKVYAAGMGEKLEITLPDNTSKVILASGSIIKWEADNWSEGNRQVELDGKAYFDVPQKGAFSVSTPEGEVRVLGTRFVVDEQPDLLEVSCYEGKVATQLANDVENIVAAGELLRYYQGVLDAELTLAGDMPSWLSDLMDFRNSPLVQVLSTLSATFDLVIDSSAIDTDRRFTGTVPSDNRDIALKVVFEPLNIQYQLDGKRLILTE